MAAFSEFIGTLLGRVRLRHRAPQPNIYHYTDAVGLCGILDSKTIHATHIAFMNDADEYKHAIDLLVIVLSQAEALNLTEPQRRVVGAMKENLQKTRAPNYYPVFVACFSVLDDDLSQWRSYGGRNAGFSVGLGVNHMAHITDHLRESSECMSYVAAAIYDEAEKVEIVKEVVQFILKRYAADEAKQQGDLNDYAQRWVIDFFSLAALLAPLLKHRKFEAEQEWRIVLTPVKSASVSFKPKQGLISPYVKIALDGPTYEGFDHPVRRVMIGPTRYAKLNHGAVFSMLSLRGYDGVKVDASKIPYRDVS